MHGGRGLRSIANGNFKTGRYSRFLPPSLAARADAAVADREILNQTPEIFLLQIRIEEIAEKLADGEGSSAAWGRVAATWRKFESARGDPDRMAKALAAHRMAIRAGVDREEVWEDFARATAQKTAISMQEHKRRLESSRTITVEEMIEFSDQLINVMQRHIHSPETRKAITGELRAILEGRYWLPVAGQDVIDAVPAGGASGGDSGDGGDGDGVAG
jgi:hypothetical protein